MDIDVILAAKLRQIKLTSSNTYPLASAVVEKATKVFCTKDLILAFI
jgi:hypothetical protein